MLVADNTCSNYQEPVARLAAERAAACQAVWVRATGSRRFRRRLGTFSDIRQDRPSAPTRRIVGRVSKAPFLSVNEKRLATGYGPIKGGDVFHSPLWEEDLALAVLIAEAAGQANGTRVEP